MLKLSKLSLLIQDERPVRVSLSDVLHQISSPNLFDILVKIQIEFSINDTPGLRIDISRGPTAHGVRSIAAILRSVFFGIRHEQIAVLTACKEPSGPPPAEFKLIFSLDRLPFGKVSDRVISFDSNAIGISIDRRESYYLHAGSKHHDRKHPQEQQPGNKSCFFHQLTRQVSAVNFTIDHKLHSQRNLNRPPAGHQTPHVPPNPIVTFPFSRITGTFLTPSESCSISSNFMLSALTSWY